MAHHDDHVHGHSHAGACGGLDHHSGDYTPQQQADLDLVLALNDRIAAAIEACVDTTEVLDHLDPDPLRYMWVDEGQGRVAGNVETAHRLLDRAPDLPGHARAGASVVDGSHYASRPTVAGGQGVEVCAWIEWVPGAGEMVRARLGGPDGVTETLTTYAADVVRPRAAVTADGTAWVVWGSRDIGSTRGAVVLGSARVDGLWTVPVVVSLGAAPAFNAELAAHADGSLELVWQGRVEDRFGVHARRHHPMTGWAAEALAVTEGVEANVWDPTVSAVPGGGSAYAWSEYREGTYRVVVRRADVQGVLGARVDVTSGRDYALHPSLAVTTDGQLWCAVDVITVVGHGGSGPTRLRPVAELAPLDGPSGGPASGSGMREPGESVPPELLPEVSASIRVLAVAADGVREAPGELAPALDVVPSGLPQLVATDDGGLVVAYRTHRRLPLMTYYWEVAVQALGPDGWAAPTTLRGSDGTLEEVGLRARRGGGVEVAVQTDARLARALSWTEGFGGRECPYLLEHHGSVVWHGIHGIGAVALATLESRGPVPTAERLDPGLAPVPALHADVRREARRWAEAPARAERYTAEVGEQTWSLFWGDLHRHSLVSRCTSGDEPSLEDFYRYAWDVCDYDFWAVTDHAENSSEHQWWSLKKIADLFHVPGRFVPLYGFEWTSADTGHQNVIYGDVERGAPIFSAFAEGTTTPRGLWDALAEHPAYPAVTIPHHPGSAMVHHDWDYHDERFGRLVEVFQACRGSYEGDGCFRQYADGTRQGTFMVDGLRAGHKFGLIASSDHGHGAAYVGAFAPSLNRGDVFEALHERRTFAATTRGVIVDLRAGADAEVFMGQEAPAGTRRRLVVHAEGYADLAAIEIVRDGEVVHTLRPDPRVERDLPADWVVVPLRVEWGGAAQTTRWDGRVRVAGPGGAGIVATPYVGPEVVALDPTCLAWEASTHSFGEPYGAQRGGVELSVVGPIGALVEVDLGDVEAGSVRLGDLAATLAAGRTHSLLAPLGHARLQRGLGGLSSLGLRSVDLVWEDGPSTEPAFYYARVTQVDGEAAWSSPIWFDPSLSAARPCATR